MLKRKQANIEIPKQTTYQRSVLKLVLTRPGELSEPETTNHKTKTMQQKTTPGSRPRLLECLFFGASGIVPRATSDMFFESGYAPRAPKFCVVLRCLFGLTRPSHTLDSWFLGTLCFW